MGLSYRLDAIRITYYSTISKHYFQQGKIRHPLLIHQLPRKEHYRLMPVAVKRDTKWY